MAVDGKCPCGNALPRKGSKLCNRCAEKLRAIKRAGESEAVEDDDKDAPLDGLCESVDDTIAWLKKRIYDVIEARCKDIDIVDHAVRVTRLPAGDGWRGDQRLNFEYYPLAAEILRLWKHPELEMLIVVMGTQTGKSTIEQVIINDSIARSGGNLLFVMPDDVLRTKIPKTKNLPILENSPELGYDKTEQSGLIIRFKNGNYIWCALATKPSSLADSSGVSTYVITEADEISASIDHDVYALSYDRIRYSHNGKGFASGTPRRLDAGGLYARYTRTRMYGAKFQCPHCGDYFAVELEDIKYPDIDPKEIKRLKLAWVDCKCCGVEIKDSYHMQMAKGAKLYCITPDRSMLECGVRVPAWYSTKNSFSQVAFEYLESKDDLTRLSDFYKSICAMPVDVWALNKVDARFAYEDRKCAEWSREQLQIPAGVKALTAGVDVGVGGFWFTLVGWGEGARKYVIWSTFFSVQTATAKGWEEAYQKMIDQCKPSRYQFQGSGEPPKFALGLIDSGFDSEFVYRKCKTTPRWLPTKGNGGLKTLYMRTSADPERKHNGEFAGLPLILVSAHSVHDVLEKALTTPIEDPNGIAFARDEQKRMFNHLRGAVKKQNRDGSYVWGKAFKGADDHLRDALTLALVAGEIAGFTGLKQEKKVIQRPNEHKNVIQNSNTRC